MSQHVIAAGALLVAALLGCALIFVDEVAHPGIDFVGKVFTALAVFVFIATVI